MCNVEGVRVGREMVCVMWRVRGWGGRWCVEGGEGDGVCSVEGGEGHQITALLTSSAKKGLNLSSSSLLPW